MYDSMAYRVFQEMEIYPKILKVKELQYLIATFGITFSVVADILRWLETLIMAIIAEIKIYLFN